MSQSVTVFVEKECPETLFAAMNLANEISEKSKVSLEIRVDSLANECIPEEEVPSSRGFEGISDSYYSTHLKSWKENCSEEFEKISLLKKKASLGLKMLLTWFLDSTVQDPFISSSLQGKSFINRLETVIYSLERAEQSKLVKDLRESLDNICARIFTETNIREVQRAVLSHFGDDSLTDMSEMTSLLPGVHSERVTPLIDRLARLWLATSACSKIFYCKPVENLPNRAFTVFPWGREKPLKIFRMASPEESPSNITLSVKYKGLLRGYARLGKRHMDLSLLSLSWNDNEKQVSKMRLAAQKEFPESLLSWASDAYSDLAVQHKTFPEKKSPKDFLNILCRHILNPENESFVIPEEWRNNETFKEDVVGIVKSIYFDIFHDPNKALKDLSVQEKKDFYILTTVYMTEYFAKKLDVDSIDTACRAHIDRGMVITTILYQYALIKAGQFDGEYFQDYLEDMIFGPSLLFENRPTHLERMQCLLSVMARLSDCEVQEKIRQRNTYFSQCQLNIPLTVIGPEERNQAEDVKSENGDGNQKWNSYFTFFPS